MTGITTDGLVVIDTTSLGDRSYLLTDGDVGVVIDPQRDIERVLRAAEDASVRVTHVLETHVHNDYVTGGLALAGAVGASYGIPDGEAMAFAHDVVRDGAALETGHLRLVPVHTPGHTPTHMSYLAMRDDEVIGLFTGGSMLYAAVGRTDLISEALTHSLSLQQHASVRHLAGLVDDGIPVSPTHGFGSHCSSGTGDIIHSGTVADERTRNPALLTADPEAFADALIAGLGPYPTYYARMDPANRQGPGRVPTELPEPITAGDVAAHLDKGSMVVDLRARGPFAAGHLPGSVNVELRDDLPTYLGWVHDPTAPLLLLAPDERDLREAQVMLARIGLDDIVGVGIGPVTDFAGPGGLGVTRRVRWPEVNDARPADAVVLDTRDQHEWDSGHHSAAIHIPFHEVLAREDELPAGPVWVYCATGNRAAVAASLLARVGREVVLIDDFCLPGDVPG